MCNKGLIEAFGDKLFNFMLFSFGYLVLYHPTPLRSHTFDAMQSTELLQNFFRTFWLIVLRRSRLRDCGRLCLRLKFIASNWSKICLKLCE